MNTIAKKMLFIGFMLLSACAHYPRQYSYYPGNVAYSSGYTIMHRNYYGERPHHYDNGYFPYHQYHDQYRAPPHWNNNFQEHEHHADRSDGYGYNHENNRGYNDDDDNHRNHFRNRNP
ncbi:MAG: hypothetical protein ACXWE4_08240 [Methylobacter sp.]